MEKTYRKFVDSRNKKNRKKFLKVPTGRRIILLPQCLRNSKKCAAAEKGPYFECADCGNCKVAKIISKAEELGYKAIYILKGGRIIPEIFKRDKPEAVAGVACFYEGFLGMKICGEFKIPAVFFPLSRDGCSDTDIDLDSFLELLAE